MLSISNANLEMVRKFCTIETAIHTCPDTVIDLEKNEILDMLDRNEISKEVALRSAYVLGCTLGTVRDMTLLERIASLSNPAYAKSWYNLRDYWSRLLYCNPENSDLLSIVLRNLSAQDIHRHDYSQERYLAAKVAFIGDIVDAPCSGTLRYSQPQFEPNDKVLAEWRRQLTPAMAVKLFESTGWDIFNPASDDYIMVQTTEEQTEMLLASDKPLSVIVSRGRWTRANIERILGLVESSDKRDGLMIILYERVCELWGDTSVLAKLVHDHLRYAAIMDARHVQRIYTADWHCCVPPIHYYLVNANFLDLRRLIETNFNARVTIFDIVRNATPEAIRSVAVETVRWLSEYNPHDYKGIRNVLNVIANNTTSVPWSPETAEVVMRGLRRTYTKKLILQFILMSTFPQELKEELVKLPC
ncbi:hypothetical protein PHOBOS_90 [Erwinia phage vB_EamM_Phobos]|uniref:hypothetical protein n=1 Tax=Erwinia phage vB_EamM_Phobos TaxID=1883377 RepID=UPI00081CE75B|nr:hypothetical protein BIZ79_gp090 [Erwinia phage vB_EamM_Phobos]ANZ50280.1 hypothetical protein PHOBOS_90 [Erwinia phage vB_EamM_Phobos]